MVDVCSALFTISYLLFTLYGVMYTAYCAMGTLYCIEEYRGIPKEVCEQYTKQDEVLRGS